MNAKDWRDLADELKKWCEKYGVQGGEMQHIFGWAKMMEEVARNISKAKYQELGGFHD